MPEVFNQSWYRVRRAMSSSRMTLDARSEERPTDFGGFVAS